jgi:carotenoid cleavage dioxygenase-like enzyme
MNHYLEGNFAPVQEEVTAFDLIVDGEIPKDLIGRMIRNGANPIGPVDPLTYHEFLGEGMVHGVRLEGGKAVWYRNRWIRGRTVRENLGIKEDIGGPFFADDFAANTHVIKFAGKTLALVEGGPLPVELNEELSSVHRHDFAGTLPGGFAAHPKLDPQTGELHALCYCWDAWGDTLKYVIVSATGLVDCVTDITLPGRSMVHDMGLTRRFAVILDLPVIVQPQISDSPPFPPYTWDENYVARVGLLPRGQSADNIRWFEIKSCFVFHIVNAYDASQDIVVIDVCRLDRAFAKDINGSLGDGLPTLDRWTINLSTGNVTEERIDERHQDFPRTNQAVAGRDYRYAYTALFGKGISFAGTAKHDVKSGKSIIHDHGAGRQAAEPVFVQREHAKSEDDGYVMTFVYDANRHASDLVILDGQDFGGKPRAKIQLPRRVPFGFHGDWISD